MFISNYFYTCIDDIIILKSAAHNTCAAASYAFSHFLFFLWGLSRASEQPLLLVVSHLKRFQDKLRTAN